MEFTAIGIDLGTKNSCVEVFRNGIIDIIANDLGNRIMPSVVSFRNKERFIGERGKSLKIENLTNTVYGKQFIKGYGNLKISDVTPFSLGIEIGTGNTCKFIKRNTSIPTKHMRTIPINAGQDEVEIRIYEGEKKSFKENNFLGRFVLKGFAPSQTVMNVDVTFEIDDSGTLTVSAAAGGLFSKITIDQDQLSKDDIKHMAQKEHKYKADDKKQQKCNEYKGYLQDSICNKESRIAEQKNKIGNEDKIKISNFCNYISDWLHEDQPHDVEDYTTKQTELEAIWAPILTKVKA